MRRFAVVLALVAGCGSNPTETTPDAAGALPDAAPDAYVDLSGPVFDPGHIVDVSITMAPADWDAMRVQTRTMNSVIEGSCLAQPAASPFTAFMAAVTVDGTSFPQVGIHKKGFFGSLDATKPSLKITFDEYVAGQEYLGLSKLTLNNSHQDPSYVRQCLAYQTFVAAGIVAPRCNFAHVHVNGVDLGVYVNVETVDHKMMKKRYADGTGNLYEGTLSDFRTDWYTTFDPKGTADRSDLVPVANVAENEPDATLVSALSPYVDVDRFMTYWAMEVVMMHWDGYANDRNNYFVYHDPTSGKLDFIPWGPDATFQPGATFGGIGSTTGPTAVTANGILPFRLFAMPATKQMFLDRQRFMLNSVWNENAMLAEITRMENLIAPIVDSVDGTAWHSQVTNVRTFVSGRRSQLTAALDAGPTWTDPLPSYPCLTVAAQVDASFTTTWGTIGAANPFTTGSGTMSITINGVTTNLTPVGATSGLDPNPAPGTQPNALIQLFGQRASDNHIIAAVISMPPARFFPRAVDLGFFDAFGAVFDYDPGTNSTTTLGFMLGSLNLTQAATTSGAPVAGSFSTHVDVQGTPP